MLAEVISIGDELTSGQRLDTNSQWLSERLGELGLRVMYHTTVADDLDANVRVFRAAIERADVVVASGGLGPTADDLTRDVLAAAIGRELTLDPAALEHIERLFARRQRPMPERNRVQAMFPAGSRVVPNPEGTAPGIDLTVPRQCTPHAPREDVRHAERDEYTCAPNEDSPAGGTCRVFALPGVPAEMKRMWNDSVAPAIREMLPSPRIICYRRIKCFGVGESDLEAMLPDLIRRGREPQVGITVSGATITLRIAATGESREACLAAMEPTVDTIHDCLGDLAFGEEDDELQDAVIRLLAAKGKTLATAEWGTGGLIADWLSTAQDSALHQLGGLPPNLPLPLGEGRGEGEAPSTAGSLRPNPLPKREGTDQLPNAPYLGGFVVTSPQSRSQLIESTGHALPPDAATESIVSALAAAGRLRLSSDYALAIGELPLYDPAAPVPPRFYYAIATPAGIRARSSPYAGPADILKLRAAKQALNLLRLELLHA
ncbi:MAG TPA: molybdopterin-binding protein [Pirellulales bacterium]|jgi:nicotinamide-nucleotide amidase|nr:molybdopterin-binding protein [Pirellulales bacterium]